MAVVEFSTSYLRLKPDYESPLETQELMGTVVEIVGEQSYWREVITPQPYRAWCTDKGLVEMTPEQLQHITEPFYRTDKSRSRAEGGAGLGLALCQQIIQIHGWHMQFESQIGAGTKISLFYNSATSQR